MTFNNSSQVPGESKHEGSLEEGISVLGLGEPPR